MPLGLSAGQWLSVPMVLIGIVCFVVLWRRGIPPPPPARR
jgi:prolipoprotein diacylglyceryltransferase